MAKLQIQNLKVSYGRLLAKPVLNISSLEIASGDIVAFYGPNHTGKSTLLKVLAGTLRDMHLHAGTSVRYDEKPLAEFGRTQVSYLPQRFADTLFPWMSVGQNLRLRLLASDDGQNGHDEKVGLLCKAMGHDSEVALCSHFGFADDGSKKKPLHLSGGQQQTLALLRALLPTPKVLVLDEPFSAIDIYKGAVLRRTVLKFVEENHVTTVLVTHDLEEAVDLADHVVVLERDEKNGSKIANTYQVGTKRDGPNLDNSDADALVKKIKDENGIGGVRQNSSSGFKSPRNSEIKVSNPTNRSRITGRECSEWRILECVLGPRHISIKNAPNIDSSKNFVSHPGIGNS